jgi:alpha-ketoglutarate-dependent taurine dioxygenase
MPTRMPLAGIVLHDRHLRVHFHPPRSPAHADFHLRWLRHNAPLDLHPSTGERLIDSCDLPTPVVALEARVSTDGNALEVRWADRPEALTRFDADWLARHAYAPDRVEVPPPPSDAGAVTVPYDTLSRPLEAHALEALTRDGLLVVRGYGTDTEALIDLLGRAGLSVIGTHFGRIEDLRTDNTTNRNTDQLGYTNSAIQLHTDQPFLERPPRYQLLHAMRPADSGGDNFLVDARAAARYLASLDRPAYERLRDTPVLFHRKQKAFEKQLSSPIIELDGPELFRIRYSYFTLAPQQLAFADMEAWYAASERFAGLVRDPRFQYRVRLEGGDFLIYDNWRMLHARTAFTGARWVRGVYFDPA